MDDPLIGRAQAGDAEAFAELTAPYRRELQLHCYRILGSAQDAEDQLQEALLAAWRGLPRFESRASIRTWLFRIATTCCLKALRDARRRGTEVLMSFSDPIPNRVDPAWLQPYPDSLLADLSDPAPGPEARYEAREAVELAFMVGLARLPPQQRAALVLHDVVGFRRTEVADMLETTQASVKGLLQRARSTLDTELIHRDRDRAPLPNSPEERAVTARFADAIDRGDVDAIVGALSEDARWYAPPEGTEYRGRPAITEHLRAHAIPLRVILTRANTQPALACYLPDQHTAIAHARGLIVLTIRDQEISSLSIFNDTAVFPLFGLPRSIRG